jgi:hypothetical protein
MLLDAIKRRALRELKDRKEAGGGGSAITNHVYANGDHGIRGGMTGHDEADPEDRDYFVDISRQDNENGWDKKVHRYTKKKVTET